MAKTFQEQITIVSTNFQEFFAGRRQLALCLGSGISYSRMPLLSVLLARAFRNVMLCEETRAVFLQYSQQVFMFYQLHARGVAANDPLQLEDFRALNEVEQNHLCESLVPQFGEIFGRLQHICGRNELFELIQFQEFQQGNPDACHYYIAYLIQERKLRRIITTNWDMLVEEALCKTSGKSLDQFVTVVFDEHTYSTRNELAAQVYAKVHGSACQFPEAPESIVLTNDDIEAATIPGCWRQQLLYEYLDGTVLFCGYSASDTSLRVPAKALAMRDEAHALEGCSYYFAELYELSEAATRFTRKEAHRHIRLYANDVFSSLYFGWLIDRLKSASQHVRGEGQHYFPYWQNEDWSNVIDRVQNETSRLVPELLESTIGTPDNRTWNDNSALIPVMLSNIAQLAIRGQIESAQQYEPLPHEPSTTVPYLIVFMALRDAAQQLNCRITANLNTSYCGLTISDQNGASRNIILLYGPAPQGALAAIDLYLNILEKNGTPLPSPEVFIVPCQHYVYRADALDLPDFAQRKLPGELRARRHYVAPQDIFSSRSYDELVQLLQRELDAV